MALLSGNLIGKKLLQQQPGVIPVIAESNEEIISMLVSGKVDTVIGDINFRLVALENMISDINIAFTVPDSEIKILYSIRKDWPELVSIIDKALSSISEEKKVEILNKWMPRLESQTSAPGVPLSDEEKVWIETNPVIRMGYDIDWPPIESWTEKRGFRGLSADYLARIEKLLRVRIEPIPPMDWKSMIDTAQAGKLDILSAVARTPQRESFLDFTEPYLRFPMVIVTREDVPYIGDMSELHNRKVGVVKGYASQDYLVNNHPKIILAPSRDVRQGLLSVVERKTFAFVGSLATIYQIIAREGLGNLKISGETPYVTSTTCP